MNTEGWDEGDGIEATFKRNQACWHESGFPPTWKVRESQGKSGNLGGQGKSGKSQGILDGVREKEEKKIKREINKER